MLTINSTAEEVRLLFAMYNDKAISWYNKKTPNENKLKDKAVKPCCQSYEPQHLPPVIYQPRGDNAWFIIQTCIHIHFTTVNWFDHLVIMYKDEEGIGFFCQCHTNDDDTIIYNYTPHFLQRYRQRKLEPNGVTVTTDEELLTEFLTHASARRHTPSDTFIHKGQEESWMIFYNDIGSLAPVVYRNGIYHVITYISSDMAASHRDAAKGTIHSLTKEADEAKKKVVVQTVQDFLKWLYSNDIKFDDQETFNKLAPKFGIRPSDNIETVWRWSHALAEISTIKGTTIDFRDISVSRHGLIHQIADKIYKIEQTALQDIDLTTLYICDILNHHNIPNDPEIVKNFLCLANEEYKQQLIKQQSVMNNTQKTALEKIFRDVKLKGFSTVASTVTKAKSGDVYMGTVEPIFAVSRILPLINAESDKPKALEAQRRWMEQIIFNSWCPQLAEYEKKYGKTLLLKSIIYLIDNDMWDSPKGSDSINSTSSDKYDRCFTAIHEAATFLIEEHPELAVSEQSFNTQQPDPDYLPLIDEAELKAQNNIADEDTIITDITDSTTASEALQTIKSSIELNLVRLLSLDDYLTKTVTHLEASDTQNLLKQISEKDAKIKQVEEQRDKWKKNQEESQGNYVKKSSECTDLKNQVLTLVEEKEELQKKITLLETSLNSATADNTKQADRIRELEARATLPRKRIVPLSRITSMPLVGEKLKVLIIALLKELDCEIDNNK